MRVELHIHGQLYREWEFEHAEYYEPLCQVSFEEKQELWARIIANCKDEMGLLLYTVPYEFYIILPARQQPGEVDPEDNERFINHIIENKNSSI